MEGGRGLAQAPYNLTSQLDMNLVKVQLPLCVIKHHATTTYGEAAE
jgi:hypothetical protein